MYKFDTKVQLLKYKVLREVCRQEWKGTLLANIDTIPELISPGTVPTMRCCVYKEREILKQRIKYAMGGKLSDRSVIKVIEMACDECPASGYDVTDSCRGCLAHRCQDACRKDAISYDHNHVAHIDKTKCVNCGACAKVCPYSAITNRVRPCMSACKVKAITINVNDAAAINEEKCISCGACVYQCPFGAITDRSFILNVVGMLKERMADPSRKVYAIVAPAIVSQFSYAKPGQVFAGLRTLGFSNVVETALGADIVAHDEAAELVEKGFLTSSCCPAFVRYIQTAFPQLKEHISHNPSPMAALARYIKEHDEGAGVVFIGPCTAKKSESLLDTVRPYVDAVMTFEELQALLDSRDIDITTLPEDKVDDASRYGRIFARSGGLSEAVTQALKELGLDQEFLLKACSADGIEECRVALMKKNKNVLDANFIEGMACIGGCISGAGCLTHGDRNRVLVDNFGKNSSKQTIGEALDTLE